VTARHEPSATYLSDIVASHRNMAAADARDLDELVSSTRAMPAPRPFAAALTPESVDRRISVIAEIKRRSPSKGDLAPDLVPADLAASYAAGGAACLSILTDEQYFGGSPGDLKEAKTACDLPVLRKDFTVCPADVVDARLMGADAVLLIVSALSDLELTSLLQMAAQLSLDALVEVHDELELEVALSCGATLVGVNQRDLKTFKIDTGLAARLVSMIPGSVVAVAESGIRNAQDVERLADCGFEAVLVGESFVTSNEPVSAVREFTGHRIGPRRAGAVPCS
jgi:indole-3-glycerol phosphate synthase